MQSAFRSVRVEPRVVGERTVLAVIADDNRLFDFGERVYVRDGEDGEERVGIVRWDTAARWVVDIEERGPRRVPW